VEKTNPLALGTFSEDFGTFSGGVDAFDNEILENFNEIVVKILEIPENDTDFNAKSVHGAVSGTGESYYNRPCNANHLVVFMKSLCPSW